MPNWCKKLSDKWWVMKIEWWKKWSQTAPISFSLYHTSQLNLLQLLQTETDVKKRKEKETHLTDVNSFSLSAESDGTSPHKAKPLSLPSSLLQWTKSLNLHSFENPVELLFLQSSGEAFKLVRFRRRRRRPISLFNRKLPQRWPETQRIDLRPQISVVIASEQNISVKYRTFHGVSIPTIYRVSRALQQNQVPFPLPLFTYFIFSIIQFSSLITYHSIFYTNLASSPKT